jgi:hypothetical protein
MFNPTLLTQIDALKARLDRFRPLLPELVDNLREVYDIRLTYQSNAIAKCAESSLVEILSLVGDA